MKKHQKDYRQFLAQIMTEAFKRRLLTHRNAITTYKKRAGRVSRDNTKARVNIGKRLSEESEIELTKLFLLEYKMKGLPNQAKRLQEQRE